MYAAFDVVPLCKWYDNVSAFGREVSNSWREIQSLKGTDAKSVWV